MQCGNVHAITIPRENSGRNSLTDSQCKMEYTLLVKRFVDGDFEWNLYAFISFIRSNQEQLCSKNATIGPLARTCGPAIPVQRSNQVN